MTSENGQIYIFYMMVNEGIPPSFIIITL
jgi:hypothetical protein